MRVRLVRRPGQHGTKAYVEQHGDRLVCVRYRYDEAAKKRYKTIEIIVDEQPWEPKDKAEQVWQFPPETLVGVKAAIGEVKIHSRLRTVRAKWIPHLRLWQIRYDEAVALRLTRRIVGTIDELTDASEQPL